jgi:acetyltransferase
MSGHAGLEALLAPRSLAVVGASTNPAKWGHRVIEYCHKAGFAGPVYAVNQRTGERQIAGAPVFPSLLDIPERVDCALLAVPAALVETSVKDCASARVGAAVIAASGFAETGGSGYEAQSRIATIAEAAGLRLLGPNCFGLCRSEIGLVLTPHDYFPPGRVALLAQSGNVAIAVSQMAMQAHLGFSLVVGVGNQIDVGFGELLEWCAADATTSAIGLYLEGLPGGGASGFVDGLDRCRERGKAVIVVKGGRSKAGTSVATTHTATLASNDQVWDALLRRHGAVRADSVEVLFDALSCAAMVPRLSGRRIAIVTDGGGDSVMAADAAEAAGLELAELNPATKEALTHLIPPAAPRSPGFNPITIDTPGGMDDDPRLVARCVRALVSDPGVDVAVVGGVFGGYRFRRDAESEAARELAKLAKIAPVVVQSAFADANPPAVDELRRSEVAVFPTATRLMRALAARAPHPSTPSTRQASQETSKLLSSSECAAILAAAGASVPAMSVVTTIDDVEAAAGRMDPPFCLKVADPAIAHKSDVHGVVLDIESPTALLEAAQALWRKFPESPLLVMPFFPPGVELLVGAFTDELFGPTVLVGRGGVWTEIEKDTIVIPDPAATRTIRDSLPELRMWPMLSGERGQRAVDLDAICELAMALARAVSADRRIVVEVNPVIAYSEGYALADIRVVSR